MRPAAQGWALVLPGPAAVWCILGNRHAKSNTLPSVTTGKPGDSLGFCAHKFRGRTWRSAFSVVAGPHGGSGTTLCCVILCPMFEGSHDG